MKNVIVGMAVLLISLPALGNIIANGSFEAGSSISFPDTTWGISGQLADGWTFGKSGTDGSPIRCVGNDGGSVWWGRKADDGTYFVALSSATGGGESTWAQQTLGTLTIGQVYDVSLSLVADPYLGSGTTHAEVYIGSTKVIDATVMKYEWGTRTGTYTANITDGTNPIFKIVHVNDSGRDTKLAIDNVSVVPEPATIGLLILGFGFLRRKS